MEHKRNKASEAELRPMSARMAWCVHLFCLGLNIKDVFSRGARVLSQTIVTRLAIQGPSLWLQDVDTSKWAGIAMMASNITFIC